ncbi:MULTISPECIES: PPK2 family polyphosphate kinase [unclassified Aeromicrobium]|uniref:PPK2 family polyphosphate kinase n=1 Tax=unclassified Aeromicrobium TaxID=2633570 RepID=UPI002097DA85|nr:MULTISPECIES: PPK2 family polyphosphate kinase [unclassified Aeromicrobium]MCO7239794.1 polyphosphate kinase 2 family protein [Aeromicrobium sp. CnD17-E]MDR6119287.1 PPK2 family polyphosphate:nucleotide phosphotransferase [Aeromicrobium sp. SORGH_AS_0981]
MSQSLSSTLSAVSSLAEVDSRSTPGFDGDKAAGKAALAELGTELADLQERLHAHGTTGDPRSVLVVLQGMDTSGKGGTIEKVVGLVSPLGVRIASFKKPTPEELAHDFLWRVERRLPSAGELGVFDRSHYEDVLIGRVRRLADVDEVERRYDAINAFERRYVESGGTVLKCLLHISPDDQAARLLARLDDPTKHWKFNPGDIDERELWDDYQEAYDLVLQRTSTDVAPWHVVPSGRKWYRNWAVGRLLLEHLRALDLTWPEADYDVDEQRARLAASS